MYTLSKGVELPETDMEFSYVEVAGGLDSLIDNLIEHALKKTDDERRDLAMQLAQWLLLHWKALHAKGLIQIFDEKLIDGRCKYHFGLGLSSRNALEICLPPDSNEPNEVKEMSQRFEYIINYCGVQPKNLT